MTSPPGWGFKSQKYLKPFRSCNFFRQYPIIQNGMSDSDSVLKALAVGVIVAIVLQVVFYFVLQGIGYDSSLLSITLIAMVLAGLAVLLFWKWFKKSLKA